MLRKIMAATLTVVMVSGAVAWAQSQRFKDVPDVHIHREDIETVAEWGGILGILMVLLNPNELSPLNK